MTIRN